MSKIEGFIEGVCSKYPEDLLQGRISVECNVIGCLMKDILLMDDSNLSLYNFITIDGNYFFKLLKLVRNNGYSVFDESAILTTLERCDIKEMTYRYEEVGWESMQNLIDICNLQNFEGYIDNLYRDNILLKLYDDGFNLRNEIKLENGRMTKVIDLLRKFTAEEVIDWYESRLSTYGNGYSKSVSEEGYIEFDEDFIQSCKNGEANGVPFESAGLDKDGNRINVSGFMSKQIGGFREGTLNVMAGYSGCGKSTWWVGVIMALANSGRKILVISNEEKINAYKTKFLVWVLARYNKYFFLGKKNLINGNINDESMKQIEIARDYFNKFYKDKIKLVSINDANMSIVKKKIRENVLRYGFDTVLYDTLKLDFSTAGDNRQDLALIKDTRELDHIAKKYNIIMLASLQLAIHTMGKLWLDSSCLSTAKGSKEVMETLMLMRNVYAEEMEEGNKNYIIPTVTTKNEEGKWIEAKFEDTPVYKDYTNGKRPNSWRMIFVDKTRSGITSNDDGKAYLCAFDGNHALFREHAKCSPKHGEIR